MKHFSTLRLILILLLGLSGEVFAQPCNANFTGLTSPTCTSNPAVTLTPTTAGGTFTGPGITGSTFNPATAGAGTHNITYTVTGVGGTYVYSAIPFVTPPAVSNFVSLSDDAMSTTLPIGFTFNFFGNNYTQFEISSNGFISFNLGAGASGCCSGQIIPNAATPNNLIAAVWDDLYPPGAGQVGYSTFGVAPNRTLVVSWINTPFCCGSTPAVTSSIVLYETTNVIEIHSASVANASPATMGIENATGTAAYAVPGRNSATINVTNDGVRFTPIPSCTTNSATQSVTVNLGPVVNAQTSTPAICAGSNGQLTSTGTATSYVWNPGNLSGSSQTVTPGATTIYTVTGSVANGCTASSTVSINVSPQPTVVIGQTPSNPICGVNPVLTANASGGGAGAPAAGPRFYVRDSDPWGTANNTNAMTSVFGAGNFSTVTFATPAATIFAPTTQFVFLEGSDGNALALNTFVTNNLTTIQNWVNNGGRLFLNSAPNQGGNMSWGFGGVTLNYNSAQGTVNAVNPSHPIFVGPFTPTATTLNGSSYSHAHITGPGMTNITTGGGVNVLTSLLWGNGMVLFGGITSPNYHTPAVEAQNVWANIIHYTANAAVAPTYTYSWQPGGATTQSITAVSSGTYTVTVTAAGCPVTSTTTITINPAVTVNASASLNPICANSPTVLTATGATTYSWQPGNLSGSSVTVSPAATTVYTVTGTAASGCTATTTITISVTALPPTVSGSASPNPVCAGLQTTLTASGTAVSYTWAGVVPVTDGVPFTPPATGTYTVTGLAANGCTATSTVLVTVANLPNVGTSVSPNDTVCLNTNITLAGTGASSYVWSAPAVNNVPFPATGSTTYTVTGTDALGCTNTATIAIEVNPLPTVFVASVVPNDTICDGSSVVLNAGGNAVTYNWTNPIQNGVAFNPPLGTNVYGLQGTDANGCINYANQTIVVHPNPTVTVASVLPNDTVCQNSQVTLSGGGASTYTWTGGVMDNTPFTILSAGIYTVTGTDGNGCTNTTSITMYMLPTPAITITKNPATGVVCGSNPVVLTASGAVSYLWTGNTSVTNGDFFYPPATGVYTVVATDGSGCTVSSTTSVTVSTITGNLALTIGGNINSVSGSSITSYNQPAGSITNYYNAACNLICKIELAPAVYLGTISTQVVVSSGILNYNGQPYVRRRFVINPATNGPAVNVTLPILQADFNSYNLASPTWPQLPTGPADVSGIANLRITKVSGGGLGVGTPEVITPTANWNGSYWELSFPVTGFSEFYIHSVNPGNVPLPVSISAFNGEKQKGGNLLSWTTTQEQNNAYFTLQHSRDGVDYSDLSTIQSQGVNGNSQTTLAYSYLDGNPVSGHNYYRLIQTDQDGDQSQHAKIIDLIWNEPNHSVSIYPNPTQDVINVELFSEKVQLTTVKVLDMSGRVVKQIEQRNEAGLHRIQISLGEFSAGVYTLQVFENGQLSHVGKVRKSD